MKSAFHTHEGKNQDFVDGWDLEIKYANLMKKILHVVLNYLPVQWQNYTSHLSHYCDQMSDKMM